VKAADYFLRWYSEKTGGACPGLVPLVGTVNPYVLEDMHLLPKQFKPQFRNAGLEVDDYVIKMQRGRHRLKAYNGIHTTEGGNWNKVWREFLKIHRNPTPDQCLDMLAEMCMSFFGPE
jgi:hypothetical protein